MDINITITVRGAGQGAETARITVPDSMPAPVAAPSTAPESRRASSTETGVIAGVTSREDPEPDNAPVKGPLLAALLFEAFRRQPVASFDPNPDPGPSGLDGFRDKFAFLGSDGKMKNGLDEVQRFIGENSKRAGILKDMHSLYIEFLAFGADNGNWGANCRAKDTQLARIASFDWKEMETAPWD
jgi:hypothetical protein